MVTAQDERKLIGFEGVGDNVCQLLRDFDDGVEVFEFGAPNGPAFRLGNMYISKVRDCMSKCA
jgi:hypothetical protein